MRAVPSPHLHLHTFVKKCSPLHSAFSRPTRNARLHLPRTLPPLFRASGWCAASDTPTRGHAQFPVMPTSHSRASCMAPDSGAHLRRHSAPRSTSGTHDGHRWSMPCMPPTSGAHPRWRRTVWLRVAVVTCMPWDNDATARAHGWCVDGPCPVSHPPAALTRAGDIGDAAHMVKKAVQKAAGPNGHPKQRRSPALAQTLTRAGGGPSGGGPRGRPRWPGRP
jgi:hypothetical protein